MNEAEGGAPIRQRRGYVVYAFAILLLVNILNFLDRKLPFILAESIKRDLQLSDTQLGLIGGLAFALIYSTLALPLARLADRWSARGVLAGSLAVWSVMTATGALAQNFWQLAATRVGVAAGEAGSTPAAHKLISELVSERRRAMALGVFSMGVPLGSMLGLMLGGWLNDIASWRIALVAVGVPGLVVAALAAFTLPKARPSEAAQPSLVGSMRLLFASRAYRHLFIAATIYGVGSYAFVAFSAPFFIRTFGLSSSEAGFALGLLSGLAGVVGAVGGGWLSDRLGRIDPRLRLYVPAAAFLAASPLFALAWLSPEPQWAFAFLVFPAVANVSFLAPTFSVGQMLAPPELRATSSAVLLFGLSLVGASFGPLAVGMISDSLQPSMGPDSLRYALLICCFTNVFSAVHYVIAARALSRELVARAPDSQPALP